MSQYITLLGAENVQSAGFEIRNAAHSMSCAASSMDDSVRQLRMWGDDFLSRLEGILEADRVAREGKS